MATQTMQGNGKVHEIVQVIANGVQSSGFSCELIESVTKRVESTTVCIMVFEKYYMRSSNRASLTVVVTGNDETEVVTVDAIGSGGGQGALFKFSWGAEEDFIGTVSDLLKEYGFVRTS